MSEKETLASEQNFDGCVAKPNSTEQLCFLKKEHYELLVKRAEIAGRLAEKVRWLHHHGWESSQKFDPQCATCVILKEWEALK